MGGPCADLHFGLLTFAESLAELRSYPCSVFHRVGWVLRNDCVSCWDSFLGKRYRPCGGDWSRVPGCGYRRTRLTQREPRPTALCREWEPSRSVHGLSETSVAVEFRLYTPFALKTIVPPAKLPNQKKKGKKA